MLELYHNDMSTCSQKARLALAEKGLDWASHHMRLRAGDQHKPEYLALNPNGVVPTLVHDGAVIIESTVINEYLDDEFAAPALRRRQRLVRRVQQGYVGENRSQDRPDFRVEAPHGEFLSV